MQIANLEQANHWSGPSGETWVARQPFFDALMAPVLDLLIDRAGLRAGARVIDIGCGTGASLLAAARAVGPAGHVTGLDVSAPMLDLARQRVAGAGRRQVDCLLEDAQVHPFPPGAADHVISRFGVMFFADPVAAFANIATGLRPAGRLHFVCWAGLPRNPWFRDPIEAAKAVVGAPPPGDPRAPGPMAFSEMGYVTDILRAAGLREIAIETVEIDLTPPGALADVVSFAASDGPAGRLVREQGGTEADIAAIEARLTEKMAVYDTPHGLRVPALLHVVSARATA